MNMTREDQKLDGYYDTHTGITIPKKTITVTTKIISKKISKCPICGCEYLMEHRYDSSFKICMKCGHNWKE